MAWYPIRAPEGVEAGRAGRIFNSSVGRILADLEVGLAALVHLICLDVAPAVASRHSLAFPGIPWHSLAFPGAQTGSSALSWSSLLRTDVFPRTHARTHLLFTCLVL